MDNVLLWDENKVNKWIASIGYPSLETQFKEQGITGDVLVNLDHDTLKDLSIHAVGQRMDILKHIYHLKTSHRIPVNEWDYIPPSVLYENDYLGPNGMADYRKIEAAFQERDIHLKKLTEDLVRLSTDMNRMREDMMHLWKNTKDKKPLPSFENDKSPPFKNYGSHKPLHSLTPPTTSSHSTDYFYGSYDNNNNRRPIGSETTLYTDEAKLVPSVTINDGGAIKVYGEKISNNSKVELEASKNVRLLSDDTCSKVITAALKKYNVVDDWRQYSLWIQYGPHDNIQERLLSYDEKPLRISQKLKEAKLNPVYILKHVKDNKPFIPELQKSTDANNMYNNNNNNNSNNNNASPNNNNNNSRSIPKSSYDNTTTTNNNNNNNNHSNYWKHSNEKSDQLPKTAIISGRVGYDVVAPVMSSSVSSPTPSTIQQRNNKSNNNNDHKTNQDSINNINNNSNNNSNSNNSNNNNNSNNSNIKINDSDKILEKEESKDNANATNSTILSQKPTDQFLTDLGLESANAIMYSLMMEQDSDKPL